MEVQVLAEDGELVGVQVRVLARNGRIGGHHSGGHGGTLVGRSPGCHTLERCAIRGRTGPAGAARWTWPTRVRVVQEAYSDAQHDLDTILTRPTLFDPTDPATAEFLRALRTCAQLPARAERWWSRGPPRARSASWRRPGSAPAARPSGSGSPGCGRWSAAACAAPGGCCTRPGATADRSAPAGVLPSRREPAGWSRRASRPAARRDHRGGPEAVAGRRPGRGGRRHLGVTHQRGEEHQCGHWCSLVFRVARL